MKTWLRQVTLDPESSRSRFLIERCYYKLHCEVPPRPVASDGSATD